MGMEITFENHIPAAKRLIFKSGLQRMGIVTKFVKAKTVIVLSGRRHGRRYKVPGRKNAYYIASSPGEPPARPTGELVRDLKDRVETPAGRIVGAVGNTKKQEKKAFSLEFGRRGMAPRPYMSVVFGLVKDPVKRILRGKWF